MQGCERYYTTNPRLFPARNFRKEAHAPGVHPGRARLSKKSETIKISQQIRNVLRNRIDYKSQANFEYFREKIACFARILTYCAAVSDDAERGALRMRRAPCGCCATRVLPVAVLKICAPRIRRLQILTAATPFCSLHPPPAALANVPVPMYADGRELLVFRIFIMHSASVPTKAFRHAEPGSELLPTPAGTS